MAEQFWLMTFRVALQSFWGYKHLRLLNRSYAQMRRMSHVYVCVGRGLILSSSCQSRTPTPHSKSHLVFNSSSVYILQPTFCSQAHVHKSCIVVIPEYFCCQERASMEERDWSIMKNSNHTLMQHWAGLKNKHRKCCNWSDGCLRGHLIKF